MDITEIKRTLAAYSERDLQVFSHLLTRFEAIGTPLAIIRQVISERLQADASRRKPLSKNARITHQPQPCQECGGPLSNILADDTDGYGNVVAVVRISQCKSCRWSAIVE